MIRATLGRLQNASVCSSMGAQEDLNKIPKRLILRDVELGEEISRELKNGTGVSAIRGLEAGGQRLHGAEEVQW